MIHKHMLDIMFPTTENLQTEAIEHWILFFPTTPTILKIIIPSEVIQTKANTIRYHLHVESKKMIQMNLFTKQKYTHRHGKQTYGYQRG